MTIVRSIFLLVACAVSAQVYSQCSISIGNDTTVCAGEPVTVTAPAGYTSYLWSDGTTGQSITTTNPGIVWCEVTYTTPELVFNGNFNAGNTGFTTDYTLNNQIWGDPEYNVTTDASLVHPLFQGFDHTGGGNFFVGNGGGASVGLDVWCQTITDLCPNTNYTVSGWMCSVEPNHPADLEFTMNGVGAGTIHTPPAGPGVWAPMSNVWNSGNSTILDLCIVNWNGWGVGNDFGIDDLSVIGNVVMRDTMVITHLPLPVVDLGNDTILCVGETITLDVTRPNATYVWSDFSTNSTLDVSFPGIYFVIVTENGCSNSDAIVVNYIPQPVVDLGPDTTLCVGQDLLLDASQAGASYSWQDGSTNSTFLATGPGTYWVDVTLNFCIARDTINIYQQAIPVVDLGPDTVLCIGDILTLDGSTPGATYSWQDGNTNNTFDVSFAGTYWVDVTVGNCVGSDTAIVTFDFLPVVDLGPDTTICQGSSVLFDATIANAVYSWQDGSTGAQFNTNTSGIYWVDVTVNNCTARDSVEVIVLPNPVVDLGPDTSICAGQNIVLDSSQPGASYSWNDNSTASTLNTSLAGVYWVDVTVNNCTSSDTINISVQPLPMVDLGNDTILCLGDQLLLDATTVGATYLWNDGSTGATNIGQPGSSYWVDVTVNNCTSSDTMNIGTAPLPLVDLGNDTTLCAGEVLALDVSLPGATYLWDDATTLSNRTIIGPGTYWVEVTQNNCTASDTILVNYINPQTVDLGPDTSICQGSAPLTLNAFTAGASYLWQDNSTLATLDVNASGLYSVVVTLNNCSASDDINVTIIPDPIVDLGPDSTVCPGTPVFIDAAQIGATYSWSSGSSDPDITAIAPGTYWVDVTINGCIGSDTILISNFNLPVADLGNDTTLCPGAQLTLDATVAGGSYSWQDGTTANSFTVNNAGIFWVDVTANGCTSRDSIEVSYLNALSLNIGSDTTLCDGATLTLDATTAGASYSWQDGSTLATHTINSAGIYWVDVMVSGCVIRDSIDVQYTPLPQVDLGNDTTICDGASLFLDPIFVGGNYTWQDGSTVPNYIVQNAGVYWVDVVLNGCSNSDTINVATQALPFVDLGSDTSICQGADILFDATVPNASYSWQDNSTGPTYSANSDGIYWVEVTANNCSATDSIDLQVVLAPVVDLGPDTTVCPGEFVLFDASVPGATYNWSDGTSGSSINVSSIGEYWVDVSNAGCSSSDTIQLLNFTQPSVNIGNDTTLCPGEQLILDATTPAATYAWQDGSILNTFNVSGPGTYWIDLTVNGCTVRDSIEVNYLNAFALDLGNDTTLCEGTAMLLDASIPSATYSWQDGSTLSTLSVNTAGTYWVDVSIAGCLVSDTINIFIQALPLVDLGPDSTICQGDILTLNATQIGAIYLWQDNSFDPTFDVQTAGMYWAQVTLNGCSNSDTTNVDIQLLPDVDLGADTTLCVGDILILDVSGSGDGYLWQDGSTSASFNVVNAGSYWVEVTELYCSNSDTIEALYVDPSTFSLGDDTTMCSGDQLLLDATLNGASYLWQDGSSQATFLATNAGIYWAQVSLANCSAIDTLEIDLAPDPIVDLGPDTTICAGLPITLSAAQVGASYLWQDGSTSSELVVTLPGNYEVEVTLGQCTSLDNINVSQMDVPSVSLIPFASICYGESILLDASFSGANYYWQDGHDGATYVAQEPGTYTVNVSNACGTSQSSTIVEVEDCACTVYVPNAFTPDGNGVNEGFAPVMECDLIDFNFRVFDRWGEELFHTSDRNGQWNGEYGGGPVQGGVYVWVLEYRGLNSSGLQVEQKMGHVTVLR